MTEQLTEREQELSSRLQEAENQLADAKSACSVVELSLNTLREKQAVAKSLQIIAGELRQMHGQKPVEAEEPLSGIVLSEQPPEYHYTAAIERIHSQLEKYRQALDEAEQQHEKARQAVFVAKKNADALRAELEKARPTIRTRTFTLTDDEGYTTTITISYRTNAVMPWVNDGPDEDRFKRIRNTLMLLMLLISFIIPWIQVPELDRDELTEVSPRIAQLIQEREPPPPPPPQLKKPEIEEKLTPEKKELKPKKTAPEPQTEVAKAARETASRSGLLAFSDTFSQLMKNDAEEKLGKNARVTSGGESSVKTERSLITSSIRTGSGGVNTAGLSRDVAGVNLDGKGSGTRVTGIIGGEDFGDADRPLVESYKGSRTDEEIQLVFDRNKSILYSIYQRELRKNPALQGKIVLRLTIQPSGEVSDCEVNSSDLNHPELERKIATRVKLFNFGAKDVDAITITYPIDFLPA